MPNAITLQEQIREVQRELRMRSRAYPRFIARGTLDPSDAELATKRMEAVLETLLTLQAEQEPSLFPSTQSPEAGRLPVD